MIVRLIPGKLVGFYVLGGFSNGRFTNRIIILIITWCKGRRRKHIQLFVSAYFMVLSQYDIHIYYIYTYIYMYIYIYMCVCLCVCVTLPTYIVVFALLDLTMFRHIWHRDTIWRRESVLFDRSTRMERSACRNQKRHWSIRVQVWHQNTLFQLWIFWHITLWLLMCLSLKSRCSNFGV